MYMPYTKRKLKSFIQAANSKKKELYFDSTSVGKKKADTIIKISTASIPGYHINILPHTDYNPAIKKEKIHKQQER